MSHHEPVEFLPNQNGGLAAQDDLGTAQMGFQFIQRGFDFPALMIERRELRGGSFLMIQNGGDEPVDRLGVGDAVQAVVNDAHLHAVGLASPILYGWIDTAQIGTVRQSLLADQTYVLFDPPQQIGPGLPRKIPQLEAEEQSISQAQHARLQAGDYGFG